MSLNRIVTIRNETNLARAWSAYGSAGGDKSRCPKEFRFIAKLGNLTFVYNKGENTKIVTRTWVRV